MKVLAGLLFATFQIGIGAAILGLNASQVAGIGLMVAGYWLIMKLVNR